VREWPARAIRRVLPERVPFACCRLRSLHYFRLARDPIGTAHSRSGTIGESLQQSGIDDSQLWHTTDDSVEFFRRLCRACLFRSEFLPVGQSPLHDLLHYGNQAFAQRGQAVFDFGRNDRILLAVD
jgi:hypothetical protein